MVSRGTAWSDRPFRRRLFKRGQILAAWGGGGGVKNIFQKISFKIFSFFIQGARTGPVLSSRSSRLISKWRTDSVALGNSKTLSLFLIFLCVSPKFQFLKKEKKILLNFLLNIRILLSDYPDLNFC